MFRKISLAFLLVTAIAIGVFAMPASMPAQAQVDGYYLEYSSFEPTTCDENGIWFTAFAQYDVATPITMRWKNSIEGVVEASGTWGLSGSGSYNTSFGVLGLGGTYGTSYTMVWKGVMWTGGEPVWEGRIAFENNDGACKVVSVIFGQVYGLDSACNAVIPSDAVVGAFVDNAQIFSDPSADAGTDVVLEVGKTAWVLGMDASGAYYKILWSCDYVWVPAGTMGPNYDDVWNGTPLPASVVD